MRSEKFYESLETVERIAYGMLRVSEKEFRHLTLHRIMRAIEWVHKEDEMHSVQTRLICYFQGNHKANSPQDLWMTEGEIRQKQKDIIEGRLPMAKFKKLSEEELSNWKVTFN